MASKCRPVVDLFFDVHSELKSWDDARFQKEEVSYKLSASQNFCEILGKDSFEKLIEQQAYTEILDQLRKVGAGSGLLFNSAPKSGDLAPFHVDKLDPEAMANAMYSLIYGDDSSPRRIDSFVQFLRARELPVKWSFVIFWLFMKDPHEELLIKPKMIKYVLEAIGEVELWDSKPSGKVYEMLLSIAHELRAELSEYGNATMVHMHGVLYVAYSQLKNQKQSGGARVSDEAAGVLPEESDDALAPEFTRVFGTRERCTSPYEVGYAHLVRLYNPAREEVQVYAVYCV